MRRTSGRITIPQNISELLTLGTKAYKKHQADGNASPLLFVDGIGWTEVGPTIEQAFAKHIEAEALKGQMEKAYRERDLLIPAIRETLTKSRNLLKSLNSKNPKRLTEWGYEIDDSVRAPKVKKEK
jgi:hypothetical protein